MPAFVVLTTVPSNEEAETLARQVVSQKLAACVQIMPQMASVYFWEGEVRKEAEHLLIIKTLPEKYDELESFIKANHRYDVPEIVAVKAEKVSEQYLWLDEGISKLNYILTRTRSLNNKIDRVLRRIGEVDQSKIFRVDIFFVEHRGGNPRQQSPPVLRPEQDNRKIAYLSCLD